LLWIKLKSCKSPKALRWRNTLAPWPRPPINPGQDSLSAFGPPCPMRARRPRSLESRCLGETPQSLPQRPSIVPLFPLLVEFPKPRLPSGGRGLGRVPASGATPNRPRCSWAKGSRKSHLRLGRPRASPVMTRAAYGPAAPPFAESVWNPIMPRTAFSVRVTAELDCARFTGRDIFPRSGQSNTDPVTR